MKKLLILFLTIASFCSFGQILQDPSTTPSTSRTNDAISQAYPASGTDNYTISPAGSFSYTYLTGKAVSITFTNPNTGASTLDFDGLGVKDILKWESGSLVDVAAGDLIGTIRVRYDGTQFVTEGGTGSGGGTNIYNSDGTLTGDRTLTGDGYELRLDGIAYFRAQTTSAGSIEVSLNGVKIDGEIELDTDGPGTSGQVLTSGGDNASATWETNGNGTVTSVGFTGGLISVGTATTTPAFTVAGTSGGIPYFSSSSAWASSAALAANALVIGGGAGAAPATTTTGTGIITALGVNIGSAGAPVLFNGAGGTPSSLNISGVDASNTTLNTGTDDTAPLSSATFTTSKHPLESTSVTTSGGTITFDFDLGSADDAVQKLFIASNTWSSSKTFAFSNATNALVFNFHFEVTNVAGTIVCSTCIMSDANWDSGSDTWTPPDIGKYELGGTWDGSAWKVKILGPFE